ncbi:C10 family peptidase, partial [Marinilabilia sp.]
AEGNGKLGYGDDNNNTVVSYGNDANNKHITTYFRKKITLSLNPDTVNFLLSVVYDDGAIIYVNGQEAFRCGMPDGSITYTTLGTGDVGGDAETTYFDYHLSGDLFVQGENIVAVEVHQGDPGSSDMGFDMQLTTTERINIDIDSDIGPLIQNDWSTYLWPYNAKLPEYNGNPSDNGHIGNGCGPTCIARLMHYWRHTLNGEGNITAVDSYHGVTFNSNLDNLNLDYTQMPEILLHTLTKEDEADYINIARLINACETIGVEIGIGFIGHHEYIPDALAQYLYFKETAQIVYRNDYSKEEWTNIFLDELEAGRPIMIMGRTDDSPAPGELGQVSGHYFICDGVNTEGKFYYNYMFGGIKGYSDIDNMGSYRAHHYAIIGIEPDYERIPDEDKYIGINDSVILAKESVWKYLDDGSDQGTAWQAIGFNDNSWQEGQGKLGYGDDNNNTTVSYGTDPNNKYLTTYFRKTLSLDHDPDTLDYTANIVFDDGAIVYVNGQEAFRCGMPDGVVNFATLATGDVGDAAETTYSTYSISNDLFVTGQNVVAVEIHQGEITSSDIGFDMELVIEKASEITSIDKLKEVEVAPIAYPNPFVNYIQFSNITEINQLRIYNTKGSCVVQLNKVNPNIIIDLSNLKQGVYIMKWVSGGTVFTNKLIKQ